MYLNGMSIQVGFTSTDLLWVNASKLSLRWYLPMPEFPTPPKGRCVLARCITQSFMQAPPDEVRAIMSQPALSLP